MLGCHNPPPPPDQGDTSPGPGRHPSRTRETPPGQGRPHRDQADTPPDQGDTTPPPPGKQTPAYGLRAAGMHPTGMHSCCRCGCCRWTMCVCCHLRVVCEYVDDNYLLLYRTKKCFSKKLLWSIFVFSSISNFTLTSSNPPFEQVTGTPFRHNIKMAIL